MADTHLMIDIETMDVEPTAAIVSIGAVIFDPRGDDNVDTLSNNFEIRISLDSNQRADRSFSASTMVWWMNQSEEARQATFMGDTVPLGIGLQNFSSWINRQKPKASRVWAKSPDFDCKILEHAFKNENLIWPFKFWESRCVRTALELAFSDGDFPNVVAGTAHDALADAKKQVIQIQHCYHILDI